MADDILNQIDSALTDVAACFCGCQQTIKAKNPSPWFATEDCQIRWNVRQITTKSGTGKDVPMPYRCRGCRRWMPLDAPLCGPCDALPPCGAERSNARTGRRMVCFRPAGHDTVHEDYDTGSQWVETSPAWVDETHLFERAELNEQVEALRPELPGLLVDPTLVLNNPSGDFDQDAATFRRLWLNGRVSDSTQPEPVAPLVDAISDTAPDVPRKSKLSELAAALRARARRGGPR